MFIVAIFGCWSADRTCFCFFVFFRFMTFGEYIVLLLKKKKMLFAKGTIYSQC